MAIAYRASGTFVDTLGTTSAAAGLPAGLANGDVLVFPVQARGTNATVTNPSGYTLAGSVRITASHQFLVFYKYVTNAGAEAAPTVTQSVSGAIRCRLSAFSGCSSTTQLDVAVQTAKSGDALSVVAPNITTATSGAMVAWCFSTGDDNTLTSATQGTTAYASDGTAGNDGSIALVYELQGSAVGAGTCTMTESVNGPDNWCTITLALRPTVTAAANPARDFNFDGLQYTARAAFGDSPFTATPTWTDISPYVRAVGLDVTRGRTTTFSDIQPGTMSLVLDNRERRFDPDYTAGPYYGKLVPQVRFQFQVRKSSVNYPIFDGYVQGWPQEYDHPNEAVVPVVAVDLFSRLAARLMPATSLDLECIADGAKGHWPLDEDPGSATGIAFDASGFGADGQFNFTLATDTQLAGEPGRKARYFSWSDFNQWIFGSSEGTGLALTNLRTFEFWLTIFDFVPSSVNGTGDITTEVVGVDPQIVARADFENGFIYCSFQNNQTYSGTVLVAEYATLAVQLYDASSTLIADLPCPFYIGQSMHIACVIDDTVSTLTVYINGQQVQSGSITAGTFEGGSREPGVSLTAVGITSGTFAHPAVYETGFTAAQVRTHYNAGSTGGRNEYPSTRLAQIADLCGLVDAGLYSATNLADHTYLSRASYSGNALTAMQDIMRTEQGRLFVDSAGVLQAQGRTADTHDLAVNTTSQATLTDSGAWAYSQLTIDAAELELMRNTIYLSTNGGQVVVYDQESRALYDERSESMSVLLDDASAARSLGLYRIRQYADPATRVTSVQLKCNGPADPKYAFCLGVEIGWRVTITRTPQGIGSAISKVCQVEGINHHLDGLGPWTTTLYLAPAQATYTQQPWLLMGDATYGKIGAVAGNQVIY